MATIKVSTKGQVVLPLRYRTALGITPGSKVDVDLEGERLILRAQRQKKNGRLEDGRGMIKFKGKHAPPDFDVATLLAKGKK